jgi:hypothetical protein
MALWTFRCYDPSKDGRGGFHGWYDALTGDVMAEVDRALDILSRERTWGLPTYKDRLGRCLGLGEIRIDISIGASNDKDRLRRFRILGFLGPGRREFSLLVGFEKITGAEYAVECPKAYHRMNGVIRDGSRAPSCEFP